jgi:hypothetical protein
MHTTDEQHSKIQARLNELPELVMKQRDAIRDKQEKVTTLTETLATIDVVGFDPDPDAPTSEKNTYALQQELKRLKASITSHRVELDNLRAQQNGLTNAAAQLKRKLETERRIADSAAKIALRNDLDPMVVEEAREVFSELLYYVAVKEGSPPSTLDRMTVINHYLEDNFKNCANALTKLANEKYENRKTAALNAVKQH